MEIRPWQWAPNWLLLGLANQWGMVWLNMGHFNLLVVLLIAIWWQIASRVAPNWRPHPLVLALFILLILIPSASCKALACLLLVASLWRRHQSGDERAVLQIVLAFTVAVLWGQQVFALLSGPVLALDAWGVGQWLQLLGWETRLDGNRIERLGGHALMVLKGCSWFLNSIWWCYPGWSPAAGWRRSAPSTGSGPCCCWFACSYRGQSAAVGADEPGSALVWLAAYRLAGPALPVGHHVAGDDHPLSKGAP